jgi:hypothetical protein
MREWTWQWFVLLAITYYLISGVIWLTVERYEVWELQRPSQPLKQLIWDVKLRGP